jgi:hypothetical protein
VAVFNVLEETLKGLLRGEGMMGGINFLIHKGKYGVLAACLVVFFTFIPFFALKEINHMLGKGRLWGAFFRSRGAPASGPCAGSKGDGLAEQAAD